MRDMIQSDNSHFKGLIEKASDSKKNRTSGSMGSLRIRSFLFQVPGDNQISKDCIRNQRLPSVADN